MCGKSIPLFSLIVALSVGLSVTHGQAGYLTEEFLGDAHGDSFDLAYSSVTFTPTSDGTSYVYSLQSITHLPTDPAAGTDLGLGDDDYVEVEFSDQVRVRIFNQSFSSFFVGSNGYVTFTQGDRDSSQTLEEHFEILRISGLYCDLNPPHTRSVTAQYCINRVAVTWQEVPEYSHTATNTFQIEMFFDGRIRLSWLEINADECIVGLSNGRGLPGDFEETDFTDFRDVLLKASEPSPAHGAMHFDTWVTLSWKPGIDAVLHDVYFGDNFDAVNKGSQGTFQRSQDSVTFFTGSAYPDGLVPGTTYYWRIDEVNDADQYSPWRGDVWSFTTAFFSVDDDFESFTDEVGQRIFETWIDGTDNPYNGATVPYADQTTVFSGKQSMLFEYNNTGDNVVYSEAKRTFVPPQDWTDEDEDIDSLVLFVHGRPGNEDDTLYIGIEDSTGRPAWVENPDPDVLGSDEWTPWRIPLSDFAEQGINLNSVMTMSIGVGEPPEEPDGPLNDYCVNARPIGNVTNLWFDTTSATFDGPGYCTISPNIWYVYTATQSGGLTISLCGSSYDTTIAVYDGSDCPPKLEDMLRCNDDFCGLQSEVEFAVTAGNQYLIEVGGFGFNSGQGQGVMTISHENGWNGRPSNDDCDNAMSVGNVTNLRFDTTYATFDGPGYCMESPNIWYTYYADHTGNVTVSLCGSSYDSKLAIYRKSPGWYPTEDDLIECNDDFCDTNAEVTFTAFAGSHYLIEVGAYNGETGQGVLSISSEDDLANPILRDGPKLFANPRKGEGKFNVDSIITVGPSFGVLMGKVKSSNGDGEGQPISGATVTLSTNPPSSLGPFKNLLPTGIDGFYAVCLIKGQTYNVNVSAPGSSKSFGVVEFKSDDNWVKTKNLEMP